MKGKGYLLDEKRRSIPTEIQRIGENGKERHVETGWAVVDRNGRVWTDTIFATAEIATASAEACLTKPWRIEKARRVMWWATKPGNKGGSHHETMILGKDAHDRTG